MEVNGIDAVNVLEAIPHGASGRIVDVGRRAVDIDGLAHASVPWHATRR
jgi:hypothetical protein